MRWSIGLAVAILALSGCAESQVGVQIDGGQQEHDHCWFFCNGGDETHVHFDFFPLLLFLGLLGLVIGVVAAAAGGGRGGQQQQQQVVVMQEKRE